MRPRLERHETRVDGRIARYSVMGEGEPVVLVHGLSGSTRWWGPVLPALSADYRLYLVNLPGFGALRGRQALLPLAEAALWIRSWAACVGLSHTHVVGHSMGGFISMDLAATAPELVHRLVLVDPAGVPVVPRLAGYTGPLLRSARQVSVAFWPVLTYDALRAGPLALLRAARDLMRQDVQESLTRIAAPTLLIWGENDLLVPRHAIDVIRDGIPDVRLAVIPRAGHVPMFDRPEEFTRAVLDFLGGAESEP